MAVSFDDARRIVRDGVQWSHPGTFTVVEHGYETPDAWYPIAGAKEWLEGGDAAFMVFDARVYEVDKATGALGTLVAADAEAVLAEATEVRL